MTTATLLVDPAALAAGAVEVRGDAYRHLFRARRLAAGERLRLADGRGAARWGAVVRVGRDHAAVAVTGPAPANEPAYALELLVAALRPERAGWLVEKATELGATAVRFFASERTPRRYGDAALGRLQRVAAAAVEQCHRARVPEVSGVEPWSALPGHLPADADRWFLDAVSGERPDAGAWRPRAAAGRVLIGPEGGWSDAERAELLALGVAPVALGARTLRVETAALAAAAWLLLAGADDSAGDPG